MGETFVVGPRSVGPRGTAWGVYFRTDSRLPLRTARELARYKIRIRDLAGRKLQSSDSLTRLPSTRRGVPCYEAILDARPISPLHKLNIGDGIRVSLELLLQYPKDEGTRIARVEVLTVRPGGDSDISDRGLVNLGCYRHVDTNRNGK